MAEELVLTVKSNIKQQTKDAEDYARSLGQVNESINLQNKFLNDTKKELIRLKAIQDSIPKGAWHAGKAALNKKIRETETSIKLETVALKELKEEQTDAAAEAKKFANEQKAQNKVVKDGIGNFTVMGVSLNGIKKTTKQIIPTMKLLFKSITAGIISTGIGVFLIAFGSLVTYVTSTQEGMDKLNIILAKVGATFTVIKERIAGFGKIIGGIFNKPFSETLSDVKDNFKGMGEEIKKDSKLAGELEEATHKLRDAELDLIVVRAEKNKQLAEARLLAEDETVSLGKRKAALEEAIELEKEILADEVAAQKERVRILFEKTEMSDSTAADQKALAEENAALIDLETKSLRLQKRLARELNSIDREILEEKNAILKEEQDRLQEFRDAEGKFAEELKKKREKDAADEVALAKKTAADLIKADEAIRVSKIQTLNAIGSAMGTLSGLLKEGSAAAKAAALAEIAINTAVGFMQGLNIAQKSAKAAGPYAAFAFPVFYATQVLAVLSAAAQAKQILGAGGGAGGGPSPTTEAAPPSTQMMSGSFDLTGGQPVEPTRAYVVSDDITNSQNGLEIIRRRATI
jgi:hypothetical protein